MVLARPVVDLAKRVLLHGEEVKDEDGHNFAVTKGGRTATSPLGYFFRLG
jgi:hypothetical protein